MVEHDIKKDGNRRKVQLEVDFVINKGHQRYYIQSALNVDSTEKREQEIASLKKIDNSFKKIVIVRKQIVKKQSWLNFKKEKKRKY